MNKYVRIFIESKEKHYRHYNMVAKARQMAFSNMIVTYQRDEGRKLNSEDIDYLREIIIDH